MFSLQLLAVLCSVVLVKSATVHVIPIIGQSNSMGYNSGGHTNEDVSYPNILQTSCCNEGGKCQLIEGQDPLHHTCDSYIQSNNIGFGMTFARSLRDEIAQDDVIVLVPAGIGGTGFVDNVWTAYNGTGFVNAVSRIKATFDLVKEKYPSHTAVLAAYLWHQGEADADVNTSTNDYLNKDIIPMINAWRDSSLISQTNQQVPFVIGNLVPHWVEDPNKTQRQGVFLAIQMLDQYVPFTAAVPSQGLQGDVQEGADPIHFSAPSQRNLGKRYHAGLKLAKTNVADTTS